MMLLSWTVCCCAWQAPGYSAMISRPMAFNTIRSKLAGGEYDNDKAWDDLQKDMETMFTNAMTYNPSDTFVHKQVRRTADALALQQLTEA